jgi:hypothetical protein
MAIIDNLISYWKLDESSGSVLDAHGSNDGTNNGATPNVAGKINTAYDFDGTNDYIDFGDFAYSTDEISVSCWINVDAFANAWLFAKDEASGREFAFGINSSNKLTLQVAGNASSASSDTALSTDTWYHVGFTFSSTNGTGTYYLNGSADGTFTNAGNLSNTATPFYMGNRSYGGDPFFNGTIDECGLWSVELTADNFSDLYGSGSGYEYPFTPPPVPDLDTSPNDGTMKTKNIARRWPVTKGLTAGTQSQEGRVSNLVAQEGSFVARRLRKGL